MKIGAKKKKYLIVILALFILISTVYKYGSTIIPEEVERINHYPWEKVEPDVDASKIMGRCSVRFLEEFTHKNRTIPKNSGYAYTELITLEECRAEGDTWRELEAPYELSFSVVAQDGGGLNGEA